MRKKQAAQPESSVALPRPGRLVYIACACALQRSKLPTQRRTGRRRPLAPPPPRAQPQRQPAALVRRSKPPTRPRAGLPRTLPPRPRPMGSQYPPPTQGGVLHPAPPPSLLPAPLENLADVPKAAAAAPGASARARVEKVLADRYLTGRRVDESELDTFRYRLRVPGLYVAVAAHLPLRLPR
eukprot:CAMPEP_0179909064 /NCGR_PEP_ID=MMETSP0982-20121206/45004_1 /TAXON_ID=483367 /ORGANISM="non described non described, Strain CCMP 2436" /LENGTH=181 /DNA_ID=CAMNT_0021810465 /DNA_START=486 /DNA_END=1030 /DNA_ORIENTATION=+